MNSHRILLIVYGNEETAKSSVLECIIYSVTYKLLICTQKLQNIKVENKQSAIYMQISGFSRVNTNRNFNVTGKLELHGNLAWGICLPSLHEAYSPTQNISVCFFIFNVIIPRTKQELVFKFMKWVILKQA